MSDLQKKYPGAYSYAENLAKRYAEHEVDELAECLLDHFGILPISTTHAIAKEVLAPEPYQQVVTKTMKLELPLTMTLGNYTSLVTDLTNVANRYGAKLVPK